MAVKDSGPAAAQPSGEPAGGGAGHERPGPPVPGTPGAGPTLLHKHKSVSGPRAVPSGPAAAGAAPPTGGPKPLLKQKTLSGQSASTAPAADHGHAAAGGAPAEGTTSIPVHTVAEVVKNICLSFSCIML